MTSENRNIERTSTKARILEATLNILSSDGFQHVTIRKIAQLAQVNVAAVNYHFGSKDTVITESLEYLMVLAKDIFQCLKVSDMPPEDRLRQFLEKYICSLMKYHDQVNFLIHRSTYKNASRNNYQEFLRTEGFETLSSVIRLLRPEDDDFTLRIRATQLISSISFPILLGDRATEILPIDLNVPNTRTAYIEAILRAICP